VLLRHRRDLGADGIADLAIEVFEQRAVLGKLLTRAVLHGAAISC